MVTAAVTHFPEKTADYDEESERLNFSNCLKDLKNLRTQLYSAAEYFEMSYTNDDSKQVVVNTLQGYAIKALESTVDHLGSVTFKFNNILVEQVDEISITALQVSCIEQKIRTCQQNLDREGFSQQSLVLNSPKYHKRYILPVREAITTKPKYHGCSLEKGVDWHQFMRPALIKETPSPTIRKGRSPSPSSRPFQRASSFLFSGSTQKKEIDKPDKQAASPHRFPLIRSGSLSSRSTTPNPTRPTLNASNGLKRYPSAPRKSASMCIHPEPERESPKVLEHQPGKSKRILKTLLSRRKSKKDMLHIYLDEF